MAGRLGRWRAAAELALVPLSVMAAVVALMAPASAASGPGARPIHRVVLTTLVPGLHVRGAPDLHAAILSRLGPRGTKVTVDCWARGSAVAGNPIWYHLASPRHGYSTSHFISGRRDPYPGLVRCVPGFRRVYRTRIAALRIRSGPGIRFLTLGRTGRAGSEVTVTCWTRGQRIYGDPIWYHLIKPLHGFAAGFYLNTGPDPARGVPHC